MRVFAPLGRAVLVVSLALGVVVRSSPESRAACNLIPPAQQAFPSTTGNVTSPVTTAGEPVQLRLTPCDVSPGFDPVAANNEVAITFGAPGPNQPAPVIVPSGSITLDACGATCATLRFTMPSTPGSAGPATITVTVGPTVVAEIGPLFQVQTLGATCDKQPETIFQEFTVLPPPNDFGDVASGAATQMVATLDASGAVIIPFDYRQILPLGPGEPVARLIAGTTSLDAFPDLPGVQPIDVPSSYVRSFTIDGRPLPPLLRATDAGNEIFGATDGAVALIRIARDGSEGVKFGLTSLRANFGYGPIVIPSSEYAVSVDAAVPLENLRSTATGVSFARNEAIEGNLNGASGDTDDDDHVVQLIDVGGFVSTNTGMAASATHNPIVGGAALDVGPTLAAFLESESSQNATDLTGDGDVLDDVLRVFSVSGSELTPSSTLLGSPFPGVNRRPVAIDGPLVYYREPQAGLDAGGGFGAGYNFAISPDGRYLYDVSPGTVTGYLYPYALDAEAGGPARDWLPVPVQGDLEGATDVAVSPDSRVLFAAVGPADTLESMIIHYAPFGRVELGRLSNGTFAVPEGDRVVDGVGGVDGLDGVHQVAVAADGAHVYALASNEDAITGLAVDADAQMTFVQTIKDGVDVIGMVDPVALAISADGGSVYVAARGTGSVWVFTRNPVTGVLLPIQVVVDDVDGGPGLGDVRGIAVSSDGRNAYAVSGTDGTLTVFDRDPGTGALTFAQAIDAGDVPDMIAGRDVVVSPDATTVYASTAFGKLLVFARTMPGGALVLVEVEGPNFGVPLATSYLGVSPDSEHVYQAFDGGAFFQVYSRRNALRAFDTGTTGLRPGLAGAPLAALAAVGGGRAVYTSPGGNAQLYDAASDTVIEIGGGIPAGKVALSATTIAMIVHEGGLGVDGNKDDDQNDGVLVVLPTSDPTGTPKIVPIQADSIGVTDLCLKGPNDGAPCTSDGDCAEGTCRGVVVVATNELAFKDTGENPNPPEADFNDNGFVTDALVPFVYDTATKKLTNVGYQAFDFAVGGRLLAFRSDENEIGVDFNGNGDVGNTVMLVYDLVSRTVVNPAAVVVRCDIPGCEPGFPYKVRGDSVVFLVPEPYQGTSEAGLDLDGDGDALDTVVVVYDVARATTQVLSSVDPAGTLQQPTSALGTPPLLPTTFTNGTIVYKQVRESAVGKDVNEDGDQDDVVTLVEGDSDGDGVFDLNDTCTETSNPDQIDSDVDSLPDACDPNPYCAQLAPAAPVVAPPDAEPCQRAIGKANQKLAAAVEKATRACLDKIAQGKLLGDPTGRCRGGVANSQVVLPSDGKTAAAITKARAKLGSLAKKCSDADVAQLGACAGTVAGLADCATLQAMQSVRMTSTATHGNVAAIADKALRACQKGIGKAGASYFASVTKAMTACLDDLNQGDIVGSGDTLCLGAGTSGGITLPSDPDTAAKLQAAFDALTESVAKACPGATAASLDTCGDDAASVVASLRCAIGRQALGVVGAAYGN